MVPIPAEILRELRWKAGLRVSVDSEGDGVRIEPAVEHFPGPFRKAAALCESLIRCHPLVDGNKRTGVTMGSYLLSTFGYEIEATQQELEDFGVDVACGVLDPEQISRWFEDHAEHI